jgi:PAS domain-containing protein
MSNPQPVTLGAAGRLTHAGKIVLLSLTGGLAGIVIALFFVWTSDLARGAALGVTVLLVGSWIGCTWAVRARVVRPLQTISNLLLALREEDFSIRAHILNRNDPLGEVLHEINALSDTLRDQRLGALEAGALLRTVMEEISVAVFAFDQEQRLKLANRAGEQLLGNTVERMLERTAAELGLAQCLAGPPVQTLQGALSRAAWAVGHCDEAPFANADKLINSSSWPTSARPCAKKNGKPGSASCGCWATNSTIRWRQSARFPAASAN